MFSLDKQFQLDFSKSKSDSKSIVQGKNYRISVLSERLVRLEYSPNGEFVSNPTQLVRKRDFGSVNFSVVQDNNTLKITTKYFELFYIKMI